MPGASNKQPRIRVIFIFVSKQHGDSIAPVKFSVSETFREMRIQGKRQDACVAGSNPRRWGKRGNSGRITLRACKRRNGFRKRTGGGGG